MMNTNHSIMSTKQTMAYIWSEPCFGLLNDRVDGGSA